ncbi:uncharacterized protein [Coffea arabica]|uniref:Uncharacterized protein isoform X2 n=1 Tax=Coffea arabica TaxID=13443 RepID=A0A6P6VXJ1_COFAR|nr:uncharacterized protein LOC113726866 isoform X2 [Coffea arabica]
MGPELELKARSYGVTPSWGKENRVLSIDSKDEYVKSESNCDDCALEMSNCNKDVEVNITGLATSDGNGLVEAEGQDATDSFSSSSFDDTDSDSEAAVDTSDAEVGSGLHGYSSSSLAVDRLNDIFRTRKKRLTSHWRTFIQPLMWRCKWVELQVKKLRSQALKYDREVVNHDQRKHYLLENLPLEGCGVKSPPCSTDGPTDKVMRRKKRRRLEDTTDVTSYMSHHNLFSYFENRIHTADGARVDEDWASRDKISGNDESKVSDERLWLELGFGDNSSEELLRKIWLLESQLSKLKFRLDKVMNENAAKFSSADNLGLVVPSNLTSSARSLASTPNNGGRMPVGSSNIASQLLSPYNMGNVIMPEGAISSLGEVSYIPDVTEGMDQSHLGCAFIKNEDEILIYDERLKQDRNNFDGVHMQPMEKPQVAKDEPHSTVTTVIAGPDQQTDNQPPPKVRSIAKLTATKSRRKKGRRKASSGRWSRRSSS